MSREEGKRARDVVERQVRQMNLLVEDLLDAARIVRGHVQLDRRMIDIRDTVRRTVEAVTPLITERGQILRVSVPERTVPVQADDARLQQAIMNLLSNAAKYTDPGGRISVNIALNGSETIVSVSDTERGIEPSLLPRVFDLFSRATDDTPGFGVGLAVTRKLVELHGGRIEGYSPGLGRGSEFIVHLRIQLRSSNASGD